MSYSIEMGVNFHKVRRLAKIIAPDFRIFATEALRAEDCVLDMTQKTIEVGEKTSEMKAVAAILFQVGHLRLRNDPKFAEHFGKIQIENEKILTKRLIKQGVEADKKASEWAIEALVGAWNLDRAYAQKLVESYVWCQQEWADYYSNN